MPTFFLRVDFEGDPFCSGGLMLLLRVNGQYRWVSCGCVLRIIKWGIAHHHGSWAILSQRKEMHEW